MTDRIVLAYSGGLTTSAAIPWLAETYRADVVALTLDFGQGPELDDVRERALAIGAVRAHVIDVREMFARDFIVPALQAGAFAQGGDPRAAALSRPLIAKYLVEIARIEGASAVAHGCSGDGDDAARLHAALRALDPSIVVIAPARTWSMTRPETIEYARQRGIPVPSTPSRSSTARVNLWGRSIEGGVLTNAWTEPPEDTYQLTKSAAVAPDTPAYVDIAFAKGVPVTINGIAMPLVELISSLATIAGSHGVGRLDLIQHGLTGAKTRRIHEAPAAVPLSLAHRELQQLVTPQDLDRVAFDLRAQYVDVIDRGLWFGAIRHALDALVARVQDAVTGVVRVKLFKGDCRVVGRAASTALGESSHRAASEDVVHMSRN